MFLIENKCKTPLHSFSIKNIFYACLFSRDEIFSTNLITFYMCQSHCCSLGATLNSKYRNLFILRQQLQRGREINFSEKKFKIRLSEN